MQRTRGVLDAQGALVGSLDLLPGEEGTGARDVAQARAAVARLTEVRRAEAEPHLPTKARAPKETHTHNRKTHNIAVYIDEYSRDANNSVGVRQTDIRNTHNSRKNNSVCPNLEAPLR